MNPESTSPISHRNALIKNYFFFPIVALARIIDIKDKNKKDPIMGTTVCLPAGPEWTQQCINFISRPFGIWRGKHKFISSAV